MTQSAAILLAKAQQALASARLLLGAGDVDGACNRAYYAMFDAAQAALIASQAPVPPDIARTHGGLITAFGLHLVKNGPLPHEIGRLFNRAEEIRLVADYRAEVIELGDASDLVDHAAHFVEIIRQHYFSSETS